MPDYPSIAALDRLLDAMTVGAGRRRQLGMVRSELVRALAQGALPVPAQDGLRQLLDEETLIPYLRLADSGALRTRLVDGRLRPTSVSTNMIRRQCVDLLRGGIGLPGLRLGVDDVPLRPTPGAGDLAALRERLDVDLRGYMPPGQVRLTAMLALVLDAAPRSGELAVLRLSDVDHVAVRIERRPQHGSDRDGEEEQYALSPLSRAALDRWLPLRANLARRAHGTSRLWVSLQHNHDGVDGRLRPPGVPLEENGLVTSYRKGRTRYGLASLLPPKLEQLRRAVVTETPPGLVDTGDRA